MINCTAIWVLDEAGNHIEDITIDPYSVTDYVLSRTLEDSQIIKDAYENNRLGVTQPGIAVVLVPGNWEDKIHPAGQIRRIRQSMSTQQ